MKIRTILEGNAFYEIDEECMEKMRKDNLQREIRIENRKKETGNKKDQKNRK